MPTEKTALCIADPHAVKETFATSVVQAALISGSSVALTLGVRRHLRPDFASEPRETICISSRLILTLDAAQNLMEALGSLLSHSEIKNPSITADQSKQSAH
jgi:hypothetical protein